MGKRTNESFAIIDGVKVDDVIEYLSQHKGKTIDVADDCGMGFMTFLELWDTTGFAGNPKVRMDVMNYEFLTEDEGRDTDVFDAFKNRDKLLEIYGKQLDEEEGQ